MINIDFSLKCTDTVATVFGLLDPSIAPSLLYYSYIPIIFVSLVFALFIFLATKGDFPGRLLLWASILFSINLIAELFLWISTPVDLIHFVWQNLAVLQILIVGLVAYFVYVYAKKSDLPEKWKWIWSIILAPIFILTPTTLNLVGFDLENCESVTGHLWIYIYIVEALITFAVLAFTILCVSREKDRSIRHQHTVLGVGATLFLAIFSLSYAVGDYTLIYNINLLGPIGMVVFLVSLSYLIVRYHAFNLRVIGAQALVIGLVILIFSALFVRTIENVRYVLLGTLVLVIILGLMLVQGVLREVRQRERLELLTKQLEAANDRLKELDRLKSEFLSIASHQLRAPIAAIRGYAANLMEGTYGAIPDYLKEPLQTMQESTRLMTNSIEDYLNISRIEQGRMKYEKSDFNLADITKKVVLELTPVATKKGLSLTYTGPEGLTVNADIGKVKQVISNVIDNAIKYTARGSVDTKLETKEKRAVITIKDTGVGISKEEIDKLFTKFTRARDANKVNTTGTGLGLYVAKQLIEGNGGSIRVQSDGEGKGSSFIIELPT